MIKDAGFTPKTDFNLDVLLNKADQKAKENKHSPSDPLLSDMDVLLKQLSDLKPTI